jgi:hypothetical protein
MQHMIIIVNIKIAKRVGIKKQKGCKKIDETTR